MWNRESGSGPLSSCLSKEVHVTLFVPESSSPTMPLFGSSEASSPEGTSSSSSPSARASASLAAKRTVQAKLVEAVKDLQVQRGADFLTPVGADCAAANALCAALEAAFVHGTKSRSFLARFSGSPAAQTTSGRGEQTLAVARACSPQLNLFISGRLPDNNFWLYVMVYTHGDTLRSIERLTQVSSNSQVLRQVCLTQFSISSFPDQH